MIVNCEVYKKQFDEKGIDNSGIFISRSIIARIVGRFFRFLHIPVFNNVPFFRTDDNTLIIFDGRLKDKRVLEIIAERHKDKRLIFYYWNPVKLSMNPNKIPPAFEKWSYSLFDSKKYGLKFNDTFTFSDLFSVRKRNNIIKYDIVFVGKDKGRKKSLLTIKKAFEKEGLRCYFHITATHPKIQRFGYNHPISYEELLSIEDESKAILDLYLEPRSGFSLRVIEAAFLNKTLITNNLSLVSFFSKNKMVHIKECDFDYLPGFYECVFSDKYLQYFDYDNWLARFGNA